MQLYAISDGRLGVSSGEKARPGSLSAHSADEPAHSAAILRNALLRQAETLATRGVHFFQLREKNLPARHLAALARALVDTLRGSPTRLLINARADVAIVSGAPGVHLPPAPTGLTPAQVRSLYASAGLPEPIISQACRSLQAVRAARRDPPSLILFSPVFGKPIPTGDTLPGTGLDQLQAACALAHPIPVFALGGVNWLNTQACLDAGARGVAGIRLFAPQSFTP